MTEFKKDKVTIDLSIEMIGKIDALVEKGLYPDRFTFVESALKNQLSVHQATFDEFEKKKSYAIGHISYSATDLEKIVATGKKLDIKVIGSLNIADNVTIELANRAINKISLAGVLRASKELLPLLQSRRYTLLGRPYQSYNKSFNDTNTTNDSNSAEN